MCIRGDQDSHRTAGAYGSHRTSGGKYLKAHRGARNCRCRLHSSPKQLHPGSLDPLIFSSVAARNMIRVVQERSEPGCGLVDAERVSCAATSTQSVLPEDGGEQRPRKQPAPAPTRCSHETPVLDGNASDESTAESPGAGMVMASPVRGFVAFDMESIGHISDTVWDCDTTFQDSPLPVHESDGIGSQSVGGGAGAVRNSADLFGCCSPSLPPMLPGAHPKPRAEDMRSRQKEHAPGDKEAGGGTMCSRRFGC